jgi:hypothetical protein
MSKEGKLLPLLPEPQSITEVEDITLTCSPRAPWIVLEAELLRQDSGLILPDTVKEKGDYYKFKIFKTHANTDLAGYIGKSVVLKNPGDCMSMWSSVDKKILKLLTSDYNIMMIED